jgi:hypothetical protein
MNTVARPQTVELPINWIRFTHRKNTIKDDSRLRVVRPFGRSAATFKFLMGPLGPRVREEI